MVLVTHATYFRIQARDRVSTPRIRARPGQCVRLRTVTDLIADHTILSVVVGSRAYGLATAASDTDRRGVFVAPTPLFWRFEKPPTHLDGPAPEQFSWEFERFCALALAANPTVLECLWSP